MVSQEKCGLLYKRTELTAALSLLENSKYGSSPMKGLVFQVDTPGDKIINPSKFKTLLAWFDTTKATMLTEAIPSSHAMTPQIVTMKVGATVPANPEWEYSDTLENKGFSFSFFDIGIIKIILTQSPAEWDGLLLGGTMAYIGQANRSRLKGSAFSFKLESCKLDTQLRASISESTTSRIPGEEGTPLFAIGLSCPPVWDPKIEVPV